MEGVTMLPCGRCGSEEHGDWDCVRDHSDVRATFALAIPHTPWIADRVESMARLKEQLGNRPHYYREFTDRESNRVWPSRMWRWAIDAGATHFLQLQDDVIVAHNFWPALRAMIEAQPDRIIGLHANHPLAPVQYRAGRRWYRDQWLTGPAYVFPRPELATFLAWIGDRPKTVAETNEDSLICKWIVETGRSVWHPVPTITDVDQGVPSTYSNDAHHEWSMYRRPLVTWRDAVSLESMQSPDFWRCTEEAAPLLPGPGTQLCWFCTTREGKLTSATSGARICAQCVANIIGQALGMLA